MKATGSRTETARTTPKRLTHYGAYLIRTPYSYCFRYTIPKDLQPVVGRKEIRYSLKTGYIGRAKAMALQIGGRVQKLCADLRDIIRNGASPLNNERGSITIQMPKELSPEKIQELIAGWVRETLKEDEQERSRPTKRITEDHLDDRYEAFDSVRTRYREDLALSRHVESMGFTVDSLLKDRGVQLPKDSDSYHQLCRDILKASITVLDIEKQRTYGDYSGGTDEEVVQAVVPSQVQPVSPSVEQVTSIGLQALIDEYQDEKVKAGRWKEGTIRNYRPYFVAMTQFFGDDTQASTITRQQTLEYKKVLSSLPPGFARLKQYQNISGLTAQELAGKHEKELDIMTLRNYIQTAESVFSFGVRNGYMEKNPAEGLKPPKKKQAREQRQPFDADDLQKLFHSDHYTGDQHKLAYQFWLPVLGLYTGCRLEELCQLYVEDVKQVEGVWCLDINTEKDKSIKNESSDRLVPLHPVLVDELDFPGFVEKKKAEGQERVFLELKKQSGDYGHYASRWFGTYKKKVGIDPTPNKKVYHSFRHNFTDILFKNMVMETIIEELTGRAGKTETSRRYAKGYNIKDLYQVVCEKLDYPVDLGHLKGSKWVSENYGSK